MKLSALQLCRGEMTASQRHYNDLDDRGNELGCQEHKTPKEPGHKLRPKCRKGEIPVQKGMWGQGLPSSDPHFPGRESKKTLLIKTSPFLPQTGQTLQQQKETQTKDVSCLLQWRKGKSQQVPLKHTGSVSVSSSCVWGISFLASQWACVYYQQVPRVQCPSALPSGLY